MPLYWIDYRGMIPQVEAYLKIFQLAIMNKLF
jgi:hypothetical protein